MDWNRKLGMVCGYYLSRFDRVAYDRLGYGTQQKTHEALGAALGVPAQSIQNWRDEFDPVHDNPRRGWHGREMFPSRRRAIEVLGDLDEDSLHDLVLSILQSPAGEPSQQVLEALGDDDQSPDERDSYGLRGPTGAKAEEAFASHHERTGEPTVGRLRDRRLEQCGYDYEIETPSQGVVAVEVKGLAGATGGVTFTAKEWRTARAMGDAYYLALVREVATEPIITVVRNPAACLDAVMRSFTTVQVGWSVGQSALRAAERRRDEPIVG